MEEDSMVDVDTAFVESSYLPYLTTIGQLR